ncbi:MAG: dihydropteroate synthase [Lentisphaerae bacterium]|nr:dihydropteroate synthase [Lentisphaerota bacterium]
MAEAAGFSWRGLLSARRGSGPLVAGIVNATPDSFSDGKGFVDPAERVAFALQLLDEGADLLDIGAESTRPGAMEVDPVEEWRRLEKVLSGILNARPDTVISIDTRHALTAEKALQAGVKIINDVSGLEFDPAMKDCIARYGAGAILTHSTAIPELMQQNSYCLEQHTLETVACGLNAIVATALDAGIAEKKLMLDVGIGFGKSRAGNYELLHNAAWFESSFKLPFCWGVSRKSLLKSEPDTMAKRIAGSLALAIKLAEQRVSLLRVHDVAATIAALTAAQAMEEPANA